jgi:multisubunit Na+/H+ antiporter MnhG subunit
MVMLPIDPNPSWKMRRRAVFASMVFGMGIVIYTAIRWESTSLADTLAIGGFGIIGAVVAAYIGGAAYEDVRLRTTQQYQDQLYRNENEQIDDIINDEEGNENVH